MHSVAVMLALGAGVLAVSSAWPFIGPELQGFSTHTVYTGGFDQPMQTFTVERIVPNFYPGAAVPSSYRHDIYRSPESSSSVPEHPMSRQKRQILGGGLGAGMAGAQAQSQAQSMGGGMGLGGMGGMGFPYMMGMPFMG